MPAPLTCDDVCQALWPDPAPGGAAWDHYAACVVCRQFFVRDRELAARLARLARCRASDELRVRVTALVLRG